MLRAGWDARHRGRPRHRLREPPRRTVPPRAGRLRARRRRTRRGPPPVPGRPARATRPPAATSIAAGGEPRRIYMNCSGKHAGMLAACAAARLGPATYRDPEHPLQRLVIATVEELTGDRVEADRRRRLRRPRPRRHPRRDRTRLLAARRSPRRHDERRVADAMRANPKLIDGTKGPDHRMMTALPGLLAKGGAEGVHVLAAPGVGAVAVKIDDGAGRASTPVSLRAITTLAGLAVPEGRQARGRRPHVARSARRRAARRTPAHPPVSGLRLNRGNTPLKHQVPDKVISSRRKY